MRKKTNCPNCGAPINSTVCPYCGTAFYDFTSISMDRPTYVRVQMNGNIYVAKVQMRTFMINMECGSLPQIDMEFVALPNDEGVTLIMQEEEKNGKIKQGRTGKKGWHGLLRPPV